MPSVRALQENIPNAFSVTGTLTAQLAASASSPIVATVGGVQLRTTSSLSVNMGSNGAGGLDTGTAAPGTYFLHLVNSSGALALVASLSAIPTGFTAYKQVGRLRMSQNNSYSSFVVGVMSESDYQDDVAKVKRNYVINGGFDFWQRGTTRNPDYGSGSTAFGPDRFCLAGGSYTGTCTRQTSGAPSTSSVYMRWTSDNNAFNSGLSTAIEARDSKDLINRPITASFKIRRSSTWTSNVTLQIVSRTSETRIIGGSAGVEFVSRVDIPNASIPTGSTSSDWLYVSVSAIVPSTASVVGVFFGQTGATTAPLNSYIEVAEVMMNQGAFPASSFTLAGGDLAGELAKCQRYFEAGRDSVFAVKLHTASDGNLNSNTLTFAQVKRSTPVVTVFGLPNNNPGNVHIQTGSGGGAELAVSLAVWTRGFHTIRGGVAAGTIGTAYGYYEADAEL